MVNPVNESRVLIEIEYFVEDVIAKKSKPRKFYSKLTQLLIEFDAIYNPYFHYSALIVHLLNCCLIWKNISIVKNSC
jgi:hypothetical protein